ncbi:MAG: TIGR02646 family protein [uncultured Sulfurovum sp.]|uniref:TIGR02646 family protein n=1 Tax=uncultured Sulfurovum sp. TaxID=269237 RepID=A0A6S6S980_9BACT|nr:MAG: TIGR02646 family protein [uncultured Sulfurovum sp.]
MWCCHRCNQNKDNNFEIDNSQVEYEESFKDKIHTSSKNYQEIEKPKMIHPEFESVLTKLRFNNGIIASDDERIKYIIETCGLDRDALNEERKTIIDDFIKVISDKELKNESISETLQELMNDFKKQEKEFIALRYWMLKNYKSLVEAR